MVAKKESKKINAINSFSSFFFEVDVSCNENCVTGARHANPQWRASTNHILAEKLEKKLWTQ